MRSKGEKAVKKAARAKRVAPSFRFPEFDGVWASAPMRSLYAFKPTNTLSRDKLNYEQGEVRNIHYGDIHTKFSARFILNNERVPFVSSDELPPRLNPESFCMVGDVVFADASEDVDDVGKSIEIIDLNGERVVAGLHTILARRAGDEFIVGFGAYLFGSPAVRRQIKRESQGAKVLGISPTRLGDVLLSYPDKYGEQQKIADCLSSLDACIDAETRKLDALKIHKQGLMHQLFPVEGQRLPSLRFPGFEGAWKEFALSTQIDLISGQHLAPDEYAGEGEIPYFTGPSDYSNNFASVAKWTLRSANIGRSGDILITVKGNGVGELLHLALEEVAIGRQLMAVRPRNAEGGFLFQFLVTQRSRFNALASGNLIPGLSRGDILGLKIVVPLRAEQKMISDCLSFIDDLIAAQARRIAALQQHKKGLMQGLFPAVHSSAMEG